MLVGTPAMWWLRCQSWHTRGGVCLCALGLALARWSWSATAGWLPWFADIDQQMYFFYAATMAPFLVRHFAGSRHYPLSRSRAERRTGADRRLLRNPRGDFCVAVSGAHRSANHNRPEHLEVWLPSWR